MNTFDTYGITYKKIRLSNGAEVRLLQRKGAPISIQTCIRAGSRYNTTSGLAHFFEHMLVAGTSSYPSKLAIAQALDVIGGSFDVSTDADLLRLTISVPNHNNFIHSISILNEILTAPIYTEATLKNECSVILNEQNERKKDSTYILQQMLMGLMYEDYELHFNNLGSPKSVSNINLDDIKRFAARNITADKIIFIVSGDINIETVQRELNTIQLSVDNNHMTSEILPAPKGKNISICNRPGKRSDLAIGFRCDTTNPEELAGLIMIQQLFTGRSSPFITKLRYNHGLVYGGKTLFWDFSGTGVFSISTSCASENIMEVYNIMRQVLNEVLQKGITDAECTTLQTKTYSHYRFNLQTSQQWLDAEVAAIRHTVGDEANDNALTILQYIQRMDASKLTKIFKKFFPQEAAYHSIIGEPSEDIKQRVVDTII